MNILVSACLLGVNCRYNGKGELAPGIRELMERCHPVPVCPEIMGGLPTPRTPAERSGGRVITRDGDDVTDAYERGAEEAVRLAKSLRMPVCGFEGAQSFLWKRHDLRRHVHGDADSGDGVTAARLAQEGVVVYGGVLHRTADI